MAGHGSQPPGDRANHPGRQVDVGWFARQGYDTSALHLTTQQANQKERTDYEHGIDAYDEGEWHGVQAHRAGGPMPLASRGDNYRAGYEAGHSTGVSRVWDPTGEVTGIINQVTGNKNQQDWDYDDWDEEYKEG